MKNLTTFLMVIIGLVAYAQPSDNAQTPPARDAADVISIFSDAYDNIPEANYDPNWGQSGHTLVNPAYDLGDGDIVLAYPNFNYQGTDFNASYDASTMEYLHIDIWTENATDVKVSPINAGSGAGEFLVSVPLITGSWSSVDLPKSAFEGMTWDALVQIKFDGQAGVSPSDIYLDNIYFWKAPTAAGTVATLSDLQVDGMTVDGFASGLYIYEYTLDDDSTIPQITLATPTDADNGATATITQATVVPGSAMVEVTSANETVTEVYTVNFVVEPMPMTAAPTPPAYPEDAVISLFSDAFNDIAISTWSAPWDDSDIEDIMIDGNATKKIMFNNFIGVDFADNRQDMSEMTHFHIDFWTGETNLDGKVFNIKLSQWGGGEGEVSALELPLNTGTIPAIVSSQWVSVDVTIDENFINNLTRDDIAQFLITSNLGDVYVDNIYFYNNNLNTNDMNVSDLSFYPNPIRSGEEIIMNKNIEFVQVFDIKGKLIRVMKSSNLNTTGMNQGAYFLRIKDSQGNIYNQKLLVK